ncbi:MAG: hypothetical protein ABH873_01455 [Candidatus Firestonebacteria bacterium]
MNVYYNPKLKFRVRGLNSQLGHNVKTRGHYIELWYNYICDANSTEIDIVDSGSTTSANANAVLIGNVIKKRSSAAPRQPDNDSQFIIFGEDVGGDRKGTLYMINNTVIAGMSVNKFIWVNGSSSKAVLYNNIFYGSDNLFYDDGTPVKVTGGYNNWLPSSMTVPTNFVNTVSGTNPEFLTDYYLSSTSSCVNVGNSAPIYMDGSGVSHSGIPQYEYVKDLKSSSRNNDGRIDIGAYEYGTSPPPPDEDGKIDPFANVRVYPNPFKISTDKTVKVISVPLETTMDIYDACGSKIRTLKEDGYMIIWDGKDEKGNYVPLGTYLYVVFDSQGNKKTGKISLIK